jgi:hypothetical protein
MSNNNPNKNQIVINIPGGMTTAEKNAASKIGQAAVVYAVSTLENGSETVESLTNQANQIIEGNNQQVNTTQQTNKKNNEQEVNNQNAGAKKPKRKSPAKKPKSKKSPTKKPKRKSPAKK